MNQHTKNPVSVEARFLRLVDKVGGCWLWKGKLPAHGYGQFTIAGRTLRAHRVSYSLFNGAIPAGLLVCHTCDVPSCVNPDHLFLGTDADNIRDRDRKGRCARNYGEKCGKSKLSESVVVDIKRLFAAGVSQTDISLRLGVNRKNIFNIVRGVSWKHVEV